MVLSVAISATGRNLMAEFLGFMKDLVVYGALVGVSIAGAGLVSTIATHYFNTDARYRDLVCILFIAAVVIMSTIWYWDND